MNAYLLSHNGLGDNISMIGAVRFLLQYYVKIYFLCKKKYESNVRLLYNDNVILIPIDESNEFKHCKEIIMNVDKTNDIFISGFCHTSYLSSKITNPNILNYTKNNNINIKYTHLFDFYNCIGLDTHIYVNYFNIPSTTLTIDYYEKIKKYTIIFAHTQGSNRSIDISNVMNPFINNDCIIICPNKNMYTPENTHYELANTYINLPVAYYIDIIKHSKEIHVIDSCFSCIVYPLQLAGVLNNTLIKIYDM